MHLSDLLEQPRPAPGFTSRPVEPARLMRLLAAVRHAPATASCFIVLTPADAPWAAVARELPVWAQTASALLVSATPPGAAHEAGVALGLLLLCATDLGLVGHVVPVVDEDAVAAAVGLPVGLTVAAVTAFGHPLPASAPTSLRPLFASHHGTLLQPALAVTPARRYETAVPLRFADLDAMGHVNNATVLTLLEVVRTSFMAEVLGLATVEEIPFILAEATLRYRRPIQLHERVLGSLHVTDLWRSSYRFIYDLHDPAGSTFVKASTVQVSFDHRTGRSMPIAPAIVAQLQPYAAG